VRFVVVVVVGADVARVVSNGVGFTDFVVVGLVVDVAVGDVVVFEGL